jgi:hypothetical protein
MEVLTSLEMRVAHHSRPLTIDFGQLVEACPAILTHLTLSRLILEYKEPTSNQTSIKCLDLSFLVLKPALAKIIETSFPQLSMLQYRGKVRDGTVVSLSNHHLKVVHIKANFINNQCDGFVVETTRDRKVECYDRKGLRCDAYDTIRTSKGRFDYANVLKLTCASVEELSLGVEPRSVL